MSTRSTIYKKILEDWGEVHVFEELGYNSPEGPGFYLRLFIYNRGDELVKISEEVARAFGPR